MRRKNQWLGIITLMLFTPNIVNALTEQERLAKLDEIPFEIIDDEKYLMTTLVDTDIMLEDGRCDNVYGEATTEEDIKMCKAEFYGNAVELYLKSLRNAFTFTSNYDVSFNEENLDNNEARITYVDEESNYSYYDVNIEYVTDVDEAQFNKIKTKINNFDNSYSIFGMNLINSIYHYGLSGAEKYESDVIINRYAKMKTQMELNPEYDYITHLTGGMGAPYHSFFPGQVGIKKNDIIYNIRDISFNEYSIIYVDEDAEGTVFEKAERRIEEYLKNNVEVTLDNQNAWQVEGEHFDGIVNKNLETTGLTYIGNAVHAYIDETETYIVIVEIPTELLDVVKIRSLDSKTGINVETSSYDVPIDASLDVVDVKNAEYVKEALLAKKLIVDSAYDISLIKMLDGTFVRTIEDGIEVYLPTEEYQENDKVNVYYVKEDKTIGEIIEGTVVKIDNKLYVKFITDHFSTYALGKVENNPKTLDGIGNYFLLGSISIIGLGLLLNKKKKLN